ncbi:MAG: protein-export chaperone SecB [Pseudomonadota bacterium]
MSDEGAQPAAETGQNNQGQVRLERMYLKDASFESPNTPSVFQNEWKPEIDLQINTRSEQVVPGFFEVVITVTVTAKLGEKTGFIAEVQYAGLFRMEGLPDAVVHRTLGTFCPNTLFPYVREVVDSLVVRGGFPPLHLVPINFEMAYEEAMRQAQGAQGEGEAPTTH